MNLRLVDYPAAIASFEQKLAYTNRQIRTLQAAIAETESKADRAIAFDGSLKNDLQRKTKRAEILEDDAGYCRIALDCQSAIDRRSDLEIEINQLRSEFGVAKLERQHNTATLMASYSG